MTERKPTLPIEAALIEAAATLTASMHTAWATTGNVRLKPEKDPADAINTMADNFAAMLAAVEERWRKHGSH